MIQLVRNLKALAQNYFFYFKFSADLNPKSGKRFLYFIPVIILTLRICRSDRHLSQVTVPFTFDKKRLDLI
jgi:hypothetical protein